jgi:hypothetical protein
VSAKYLLPCPCGAQMIVEPRQAGQTVPCACGSTLQVPTLLDMTALEPAPSVVVTSEPTPQAWGVGQQMRLLGTVLLLAAIVLDVLLYIDPPRSRFDVIDPEWLQTYAQKLSPVETLRQWEYAKQGLDRHVDQKYLDDVSKFHLKVVAVAALALAGVVLIAAGVVASKGGKSVY